MVEIFVIANSRFKNPYFWKEFRFSEQVEQVTCGENSGIIDGLFSFSSPTSIGNPFSA
jgi:hypothetical protein